MKIDIEFLKSELAKHVTEKRYQHSLGVAKTAKELASRYGANPDKAEISGILHDIAKYWPKEKLMLYIRNNQEISNDLLEFDEELWHGPVASIYIQERYHITDMDIIGSIRYHTSGRAKMTALEKIICLADYIEPSRNFSGVDELREISQKDLNEGLLLSLDGTINYLLRDRKQIYPLTVEARNSLLDEIYNNNKEDNEWD